MAWCLEIFKGGRTVKFGAPKSYFDTCAPPPKKGTKIVGAYSLSVLGKNDLEGSEHTFARNVLKYNFLKRHFEHSENTTVKQLANSLLPIPI